MIKVSINNICAKLTECEPLTSGMIGKTLDVELSADWAGLSKTAVFSNGDKTIDVMESEWNGNTINIPWEVIETPNRAVSFGIYGYTKSGDDIILAIPTLYTSLGRVYLGTNPEGDESTEPSLPVYAQLDLRVTDLEEHGGGITDAPIDGKQYARQDGAWSEVQSGGADTQWNGKTAVFFGDSITEQNIHYTKGYHSWIKDIIGLASYTNAGRSGHTLGEIYVDILNSTAQGDLIMVAGGVNNIIFNTPLGQMGDNTIATIYGSIQLICELIKSKYPTSTWIVMTPTTETAYESTQNVQVYQVAEAISKVCAKEGIICYNNYVNSGLVAENVDVYTRDNLHWNDKMHEKVGKNLAKFILDTCRYVYAGQTISVTGVTLNKNSTTITEGNTETLAATVAPVNATNKSVVWSTSNSTIATVNNGVVTAVSDGNATITVTTVDGGFTATCAVTVEAGTIVVTGITLNKATTTITEGATETLVATLQPAGASGTITWASSDDTKATVANGVVTAVAEGDATITASCDGFSASCVVTVEAAAPIEITLSSISDTCDFTFTNGTLAMSSKTQTFAGVDFNNCTNVYATSKASQTAWWIGAKRLDGTYMMLQPFSNNGYGQVFLNVNELLTTFGSDIKLINTTTGTPVTMTPSNFEVSIVGGKIGLKVDGANVEGLQIPSTDSFTQLAFITSGIGSWPGVTLT